MISVRVGTATDCGNVRRINEDASFTSSHLFAVADGMGGHAAGDVASAIAVARLARLAQRAHLQPGDVRTEVTECNREILAAAAADQTRSGMGTTLAGVGVTRLGGTDHWVVFNVGDSRVYRFTDGSLVQVTVDHSEVAELVAAGTIRADEAHLHPKRNVITRVLGMRPDPAPDLWVFPLTPGERFVICTDGLSSELTDDQIARVLYAEPTAPSAAQQLVAQAVAAGGRDNVTVVVVDHLIAAADGLDEDTLQRSRATGATA
ncbi:serine/threonine protein phosphatase [Catellatospora methionotrophica]|uniref:Serine/threonine protein phosphatase n=1 Tax=Catellatospora methionotrophica TaxID=121620 RepID=A0A8J3PHY6_9ACTN|nr:protein phosphatase 2C domain-containing protein [Catellatospora methionotrophica]GIG17164.1 serine/threonine protein phosphatase [Catellatospora methionotrophica]